MKHFITSVLVLVSCTCALAQKVGQVRIDSLLKVSQLQADGNNKILTLIELANAYADTDPSVGLHYGQQALHLSQTLKNDKGVCLSHVTIGLNYKSCSQFDSSLLYFQLALENYSRSKDKGGIANCFGNIGNIYREKLSFYNALKYYFQALAISEEIGDVREVTKMYGNIGIIYKQRGDYKKAIEYYNKALKNNTDLKNPKGIAVNYLNIGSVYEELKDYVQALSYYNAALEINQKYENNKSIAINLGNIGEVYSKQGNCKQAIEYLNRALHIDQMLDARIRIATDLGDIGSCFLNMYKSVPKNRKKEDLQLAIDYLNKSVVLCQQVGQFRNLEEYTASLSEAYELHHDYKEALKYALLNAAAKDSMVLMNSKNYYEIESQRDNLITQREKEQQKEAKEEQDRLHWAYIIMVLITIISLIFVFLRYRIGSFWISLMGTIAMLSIFAIFELQLHPLLDDWSHGNLLIVMVGYVLFGSIVVPCHIKLDDFLKAKIGRPEDTASSNNEIIRDEDDEPEV